MSFTDRRVQAGKDLFNGVGTSRACSPCHNNAGANNADGFNGNFGTNVAQMGNTPARRLDPMTPGDGGFGPGPEFKMPEMPVTFRGNGSMNTPALVEAADTPPFFHNNAAATIEDAVHFYATPAFSSDNAFQLSDGQVHRVGAFLRAINALENIRYGIVLAKAAQRQRPAPARQTIEVLMAETEDAIAVLSRGPLGPLHPDAIAELEDALRLAENAHDAKERAERNVTLREALKILRSVPDLILQSEEPEVSDASR
jgi:cytochrome c peroxidase